MHLQTLMSVEVVCRKLFTFFIVVCRLGGTPDPSTRLVAASPLAWICISSLSSESFPNERCILYGRHDVEDARRPTSILPTDIGLGLHFDRGPILSHCSERREEKVAMSPDDSCV